MYRYSQNRRIKCPHCETINGVKTGDMWWCVKCGRMWSEEQPVIIADEEPAESGEERTSYEDGYLKIDWGAKDLEQVSTVNEKPKCPDCGSANVYYRKTYDNWRCNRCGCQNFGWPEEPPDDEEVYKEFSAKVPITTTKLPMNNNWRSEHSRVWFPNESDKMTKGDYLGVLVLAVIAVGIMVALFMWTSDPVGLFFGGIGCLIFVAVGFGVFRSMRGEYGDGDDGGGGE